MAEDELATPHRGSREARTPVTGPSRTARAERSAALGSGAQTLRRGGNGGGLCLFPGRPLLPRGPPAPEMTQRFPRTQLSPPPSLHPPQGTGRPTRHVSESPAGGDLPARGPGPSRTADPFGVQGWERGRGTDAAGGASRSSERRSAPTRGKEQKASRPRQLLLQAGLELSAQSGQLPNPRRPCCSRSDPVPTSPAAAAAANHRASPRGKAGAAERRRRWPMGSRGGGPRSPR